MKTLNNSQMAQISGGNRQVDKAISFALLSTSVAGAACGAAVGGLSMSAAGAVTVPVATFGAMYLMANAYNQYRHATKTKYISLD